MSGTFLKTLSMSSRSRRFVAILGVAVLGTAAALSIGVGTASAQGIFEGNGKQKRERPARNPITTGSIPSASTPVKEDAMAADGLTYCNQMESKPLGLKSPGGKSLVQFDKCYRGRLHNVCLAKALSVMITSLQKDYEKLVQTDYPAINSTAGVCTFSASQLSADFETARAFNARYKALVGGYDERLKCTDLVLKSLEKASFPDMPNVEKTVKTMADELKNDIASFSKERQAADELLAKVTEAQKALEVHSDVHRAMCITADATPPPRQ